MCELRDAHGRSQSPPPDKLLNTTIDEPSYWDLVVNFRKTPTQTDASYEEQLFTIKVCVESINSCLYLMNTISVNNVIIAGFPGGGKKIVMMYIVINSRSKGLAVITVAMIFHQAIQLGGWHWNKLLCIHVYLGNNMSIYRMTELSIQKLEHFPNIIEFIRVFILLPMTKLVKLLTNLIMLLTIFSKLFLV